MGWISISPFRDYDGVNGQIAPLQSSGFDAPHARLRGGTRDTLEHLAVHAEGVRPDKLQDNGDNKFREYERRDGNARMARADRGVFLRKLKIAAALRHIRIPGAHAMTRQNKGLIADAAAGSNGLSLCCVLTYHPSTR